MTVSSAGTWWRTMRIIGVSWRAEIARSATYRADLAIGVVVNVVWLGVAVSPVLFAFGQLGDDQSTIGDGWTLGELLYLQALWWLLDAVVWMILVPNLSDLSAQVASGTLDMLLLKPVNSMVYVTSKRLDVVDALKLPLALSIAAYALWRPDTDVSPPGVAAGVVAFAAAVVLMWALGIVANVKALTTVRFDAGWLAVGAHNLSRAPISFYGRSLRLVLSAVVPIVFLTTVPSELIFGRRSWWWALVAIGVAAAVVALAAGLWNREVRRYSGAMS